MVKSELHYFLSIFDSVNFSIHLFYFNFLRKFLAFAACKIVQVKASIEGWGYSKWSQWMYIYTGNVESLMRLWCSSMLLVDSNCLNTAWGQFVSKNMHVALPKWEETFTWNFWRLVFLFLCVYLQYPYKHTFFLPLAYDWTSYRVSTTSEARVLLHLNGPCAILMIGNFMGAMHT